MEHSVFYEFITSLLSDFSGVFTDYEMQAATFALCVLCLALFITGFVSALFGAMNALLANRRK